MRHPLSKARHERVVLKSSWFVYRTRLGAEVALVLYFSFPLTQDPSLMESQFEEGGEGNPCSHGDSCIRFAISNLRRSLHLTLSLPPTLSIRVLGSRHTAFNPECLLFHSSSPGRELMGPGRAFASLGQIFTGTKSRLGPITGAAANMRPCISGKLGSIEA